MPPFERKRIGGHASVSEAAEDCNGGAYGSEVVQTSCNGQTPRVEPRSRPPAPARSSGPIAENAIVSERSVGVNGHHHWSRKHLANLNSHQATEHDRSRRRLVDGAGNRVRDRVCHRGRHRCSFKSGGYREAPARCRGGRGRRGTIRAGLRPALTRRCALSGAPPSSIPMLDGACRFECGNPRGPRRLASRAVPSAHPAPCSTVAVGTRSWRRPHASPTRSGR